MDGAVAVPPLCYHRLTEEQHLLLIEKGKKLFESLQDRPSRLDVPSTLSLAASITRRQTTDSIPDVTPAQKERHALQQENKILRSRLENLELHVDSNLDPLSPSRSPISSRKNLRSLDKEGALHQENESLRRHVNQLTTSGKQNFEKIQTLEKTNQHLEAKLQLYRRELQRKEEEEQQHSLVTTTTVPLVGAAPLSRQHEIDRTENIRLRRLLAERNELTLSLKDDLERMVKERVRYLIREEGGGGGEKTLIFFGQSPCCCSSSRYCSVLSRPGSTLTLVLSSSSLFLLFFPSPSHHHREYFSKQFLS